jgi:serine/threonine-protein kinase
MYELLSGEKPFRGETMTALMYSISTASYNPLAKIRPKLPEGCHTVVTKLLQKTLTRRYKSAAILHQELLSLQAQLERS